MAARTLKRYDEAKKGYEKVLSISPNNPGAIFNLTVLEQDYSKLPEEDYAQRRALINKSVAQYNQLFGGASKSLQAKLKQRLEDAQLDLEQIESDEQDAKDAAAEAAEAAAEKAAPPQ